MALSRRGLKLLGLCVLALGLMAVVTSAAQAEVGAKWVLKNKEGKLLAVEHPLLPTVQIKEIEKLPGTEERHAVLLTKIAGTKVDILCTEAALVGVKLENEGSLTNGGKVKFSNCIIKLNGTTSPPCEPHTGLEKGVVVTNEGKGLIVLHLLSPGGVADPIVRIEAKTGETLATVETGAECAIGSKIPIIGKLTIKDCKVGGFTVEALDHLIEQGPLTELWAISKTAEHVANIDGSALVRLIGEDEDLEWAGLPSPTKP
jgi:hypothetical protein